MNIRKRNGSEVKFNRNNIVEAISRANEKVRLEDRLTIQEIKDIAKTIDEKCKTSIATIQSNDIQNFVENSIMEHGKFDVAKEYITYRYQKALDNRKNTIDDRVLSLLNNDNEDILQENANKNPTIVSTMRDYMAGEVSKDISQRYLLPADIYQAHKEGKIHFHDMDYFAMPIHNCFTGQTKFITDKGVRTFDSFNDGDAIKVKDKDGVWRDAIVRCYGKQLFNKITLKNNKTEKVIYATGNHRWVLKDGSITTELKENDVLYGTKDSTNYEIKSKRDAEMFCLGFSLGDGCDHKNATQVRLCGNKIKWKDTFKKAGWSEQKNDTMYYNSSMKQDFLNSNAWRFLSLEDKSMLFHGYYAADGSKNANRVATSDERICKFIEDCSCCAGYYITSKNDIIHDTNYKENANLSIYYLTKSTNGNHCWKVKSIENGRRGIALSWCVEEPITKTFLLENGIVTGNCDLWNLEDMLQNGTVINNVKIEKPHTFLTAATITSQISAIVASSQYGGQTFTLAHLAPFVEETRNYFRKKFKEELTTLTDEQLEELVEKETRRNVKDGIQTLQYQLVTISTTNGQTPFVSVCMYLNEAKNEKEKEDLAIIIEEVLKQRIQGLKNEAGEYVTNAFPKLLYILEEDNIHEGDKYYYLTELAAQCTMKRMVPDYISEKVMKEWKKDKKGNGYCFPTMGCRSILSVWTDPKTKKGKFYSRFNKGVVTINLPYVALECRDKNGVPNIERFWYMLGERLELCHRALRLRHEHLVGVKSDVAPILWQHGALARLKPGETIDKLLYNGYSTISLGYVGLWETVKLLTNENTWDEKGHELAIKIMKKLKESCEIWDSVEHIGYSLYGTPEESTTFKFAEALQKSFGIVKGVTDKNYVTNSYHVPVWEGLEDGMDAFRKIDIETEFQKYSVGGAISYIEAPITNNKQAILTIIKYIYDNIVYCEINNMGSCHCGACGTDGNVTLIPDENGKLHWHCNNCGCEDLSKLTCVVRVCGYLSSGNAVNQGRLADIRERKTHI